MIPFASSGFVYSAAVAYENNKNHFQFAAQVTNTCSPHGQNLSCYATPSARNYGCSAAKRFAVVADGKAVYPEVSRVPPSGATLGHKVLNVGGISRIGISTTANDVVGMTSRRAWRRLRAKLEVDWDEVILLLCPERERRPKDGERTSPSWLIERRWREALLVVTCLKELTGGL